MPEHLERLGRTDGLACTVTNIEGNLFVDAQVKGYISRIAHPLGMCDSLLGSHAHAPDQVGLAGDAVIRRDPEWHASPDLDLIPAKEAVELLGTLAPGTCLDHEIRRPATVTRAIGCHAKQGLRSTQIGVYQKELDEEGALLARDGVAPRKRVSPPVITLLSQSAGQHKAVARNVMIVRSHDAPLGLPFRIWCHK